MMQFVDSFTCMLSKNNDFMVIHLTQQEPFVDDTPDGETSSVRTQANEMASIVMESKTALDLCNKAIEQLYRHKALQNVVKG